MERKEYLLAFGLFILFVYLFHCYYQCQFDYPITCRSKHAMDIQTPAVLLNAKKTFKGVTE